METGEGETDMPRYIQELVTRQVRKADAARQAQMEEGNVCLHPVITISRRMGSGARIVASMLADELGWSLWDKEIIETMAEDAEVSKQVVERFDEHVFSEIEMIAHGFLGDHETAGFSYPKRLVRVIGAVSKLGNAIILGRGANFILPDALHVRIDASDELRIKNMMSYEDMTHEAAEAKIRQSDKDREAFLVKLFGKGRAHHTAYDLTIWMDKFSNEGAVEIIKSALIDRCRGGREAAK